MHESLQDNALRGPIRILRLASTLVPASLRADWIREWEGELAAGMEQGRRNLTRHALGAVADAFWLRQRSMADAAWIDDLRHAWRQFRQQLGFTVTATGILAVGMAASVVAFSVVSQMLLRPLPYLHPDGIVTLWERHAASGGKLEVAPANFLDWRAQATSFTQVAGAEPYSYDYTGGDRPEVLRAANVTEGFFDVFGLPPLAGRFFNPDEHKKGNHRVVVLSARLWRSLFGADPGIVGRTIPLDNQSYTVVGIAADEFQPYLLETMPGDRGLWAAKAIEEHEQRIRASGYWQVVARLKDGETLQHATAEMDTVAARIEAANPGSNKDSRVRLLTLREHLVGDVRPAVSLFSAAVFAVLLIACVNVTNLLLARGSTRQQELAIRTALGANRRRLIGQLMLETLSLAAVAGIGAIVLAEGAMRALARLGPRDVMWIDTLHVDRPALLFVMALAVAVAVAAGLIPAFRLSSIGLQTLGARTMTADRSQRRLRSTLVAAEVALALMLVSGTALLLRSFVNLLNVDTGFRKDGVMVLQIFAWDRNPGPVALKSFFDRVIERVDALPGVEGVGAVQAMPFIESNVDIRSAVRLLNQPAPAPGDEIRSSINVVTPGYFSVMGIRSLKGRLLDHRDGPETPRVVLISEAFAERYLRGIDPLGQRIEYRASGKLMQAEIVGVTTALRHEKLDEAPRAEILIPFAQSPSGSMTVVARTNVDPRTLIESAKAEVWAIDPLQTFYRTATLDELVGRTLTARRFALIVLTGFAALAMLLAAAGLYGVLTAIVSQYRREIGVRVALGADWADIVRLVVSRGLAVSAVGVAVGLAGALGGARLLTRFLFSVVPTDPIAIGGAAALMFAISAIACYLPARRAANADPLEVLRME
jgi:putative ABC transport system permease protein